VSIWRKLKQNRAETLVETLVSILIVALASTMLLTAVTTASRLNQSARESQETYESALETAETGTVAPGAGNVTISDGVPGGFSESFGVNLYYKDEDSDSVIDEDTDFVRWSKT
jgi:type II secretory pathway pseudopilin PulG